eukprot:g9313.t1
MRTESTKYVYPYVRCKIRAFVTRIIGNSATRPATKVPILIVLTTVVLGGFAATKAPCRSDGHVLCKISKYFQSSLLVLGLDTVLSVDCTECNDFERVIERSCIRQETLQAITAGDRSKVILNVGCGLDRLSPEIYADGYTNLLSSDISAHAIAEMQKSTAEDMPMAKWLVDDIMDMSVPSESVDIVVDKAAFLVNGRAIVDS